jgi:LysR family hydrogen peroxide-inducible transcriptional activator
MGPFLPTLRQLAYLVALDDHRHFGRAAEAMAVSQSTLSSGLRELESLLGVPLAERSRRGVHFTQTGTLVVARARDLLRAAEDLTDLVRARAEPMTGEIRLAVIPTIAPFLLPGLLGLTKARWPKLKLSLREETSAAACEALHRGQVDCVLLALPFPCSGVDTRLLGEDRLQLALPAAHPLAGLESIPAERIPMDQLLMLEDGHCLKDHALAACGAVARAGDGAMIGTSLHTLVQMVAGGLGLTFLPEMAVGAGLAEDPTLAVRPILTENGRAAARKIALIWRRDSPQARDFGLLGDAIAQLINPCGEGRSANNRTR